MNMVGVGALMLDHGAGLIASMQTKWMVYTSVSKGTDLCIKPTQYHTVLIPVPVDAKVNAGICAGVPPWYSNQHLLKLKSVSF